MSDQIFNVLFRCTGNSARSILAESILNREGQGRFKAFSAGSHPKGAVHPYTLQLLKTMNHDISFARSKDWDEFAARMHRRWISCSPSAATPPTRLARFGRDSR